MKVTLRQLQVFVLTAKYGNITQAANHIPVSQAAASMSLAQLENLLGSELFTRSGKRLLLSEAGKRLLPAAHSILQQTQAFEASAQAQTALAGCLKIAASTTIANHILPSYISAFRERYPAIELIISVGNTHACINKLSQYRVDAAIVEGLQLRADIEYEAWMKDELVIFCHPKHSLAKKSSVSLKDLEASLWVLRERESGTYQALERVLEANPIRLNNPVILGSSEAIKNFIRGNEHYLSCLSKAIIEEDVKAKKLHTVTVRPLDITRNFYIAKRKTAQQSSLIEFFLTSIRVGLVG